MRVLGVIPARANSKSIKGKNTAMLCGKPLIAYTLEAARGAVWLFDRCVTTDCPLVAELGYECGASVIERPAHLALDDTPMIPVLQHALAEMQQRTDETYDTVMLLQPTCPMRRRDEIDGSIMLMKSTKATSVISYVNVGANHPARMVVMLSGGQPHSFWSQVHTFSNKQELPDVFIRSGDIYLVKADCLARGDLLGDKPRAYTIRPERHCNVDSPLDLLWAEFLLSREAVSPKSEPSDVPWFEKNLEASQ
jgi:CMP-N,N'-diacetyllegionaminic acid synthase